MALIVAMEHMHNPEYVLENETAKTLWNFEIQTDHQI